MLWENGGGVAGIPYRFKKDNNNEKKSGTFNFHEKEQKYNFSLEEKREIN